MPTIYKILLVLIFQFSFYCSTIIDSIKISPRIFVLCYHTFINHVSYIDFSEQEINDQILFFKENNFHFISMQNILNNQIQFKNNILITIDDGHKSQYNAYFSIFKKYNISPTFFIIAGCIGSNHFMTKDQISQLKQNNCTIANHSWNHPFLNEKFKGNINKELLESQKYLNKISNEDSLIFAYPYGAYCENIISYLQKFNFKYAFTIDEGYITFPIQENKKYILPRYMITHKDIGRIEKEILSNKI